MALTTDSAEYEILFRAVGGVAQLDRNALSCEIGLREGGGSKWMIEALAITDQFDRTHIAIDPYGNIEYETAEGIATRHDYTNEMRNRCMKDLYQYLSDEVNDRINVLVFILEDTEFFTRFENGVPLYSHVKRIADKYAVIHFDGPHAHLPLIAEAEFFIPRTLQGGMFVFDDIGNYDHQAFEDWLLPQGFILVEKGVRKASYRKI